MSVQHPKLGRQNLLVTRGRASCGRKRYQPVERSLRKWTNKLAALWEHAAEMRQRPENCGARLREVHLKAWRRRRGEIAQ